MRLWPFSRKASITNSLELLRELYGGRSALTGDSVTWETALQVSTVFACARVIGDGIAQVPFKLFRESDMMPAKDHPLYRVLYRRPNPWQTSFEYRQMMGLHLVLTNNHYAFKNVVRGNVEELIPFEPNKVTIKRQADNSLRYVVAFDSGRTQEFPEEAIWHVKGPSWNGWQGLQAFDLAREAIGLAMATERQHAKLHANGIQPAGTYSVEGKLNPQQYKDLRQHIIENTSGANAGMPLIVDNGAKWLSQAMSGVDAQHLETRKFQVEEICRALRVMPIMVGHADKTATYASAEQMFIAHVVHTLSPWYECIEQSADVHLLTERDYEQGIYAKFVVQGLMRGSMKDRADYFAKALGAGGSPAWMTQDQVRALEEMPPMGGDAAKLPQPTNVGGTPKEDPNAEPDV